MITYVEETRLTPRERYLLERLADANIAVTVASLYEGWYEPRNNAKSVTQMQRALGAAVTGINRKIKGAKVKPGDARGTYILVAE